MADVVDSCCCNKGEVADPEVPPDAEAPEVPVADVLCDEDIVAVVDVVAVAGAGGVL